MLVRRCSRRVTAGPEGGERPRVARPPSLHPERMLRPAGGERPPVARPPLLLPVRTPRLGSHSARTLIALGPGDDSVRPRLLAVVKKPSRAATPASTSGRATAGRLTTVSREGRELH